MVTDPGEYELPADAERAPVVSGHTTEGSASDDSTAVRIDVRASDVTREGSGHAVERDGEDASGDAVRRTTVGVGVGADGAADVSNVTVSDLTTTGFARGVTAGSVDGVTVAHVVASGNDVGIVVDGADAVRLAGDDATDNDRAAIAPYDATDAAVAGNDVSGTLGESVSTGSSVAGVLVVGGSDTVVSNTTALDLLAGDAATSEVTPAYVARNTSANVVETLRSDTGTVPFEAVDASVTAVESTPSPPGASPTSGPPSG